MVIREMAAYIDASSPQCENTDGVTITQLTRWVTLKPPTKGGSWREIY